MLFQYFLHTPIAWGIPWIIYAVSYYRILHKMGLGGGVAAIPVLAEYRFTRQVFPRKRTFFRPFIITVILVIAANYLGPTRGTGLLYMVIAFIVYGIFLIRLYFRLARSFGKSVPFALGMSFFPIIFLPILAFGKSAYLGKPEFKPRRQHSKPVRILLNACYALISVAEVLLLIAVVGFFTIRALPPRILVNTILNDFYASTSGITGGDSIVTREDALGEDAAIIDTLPVSRAHFVEDHSADQNAVVITYIVGSNLENRSGLATANIHQMMEASQKGSGLTFVIQAGGSERWFTDGIEDSSYGRYTIQDGQLTKVQELDSSISMADPAQFADFLAWTRDNYPADRYMLVLWDHGGGVPNGYGLDDLHERSDGETVLSVSEIRDAIDQSGIRFDLIGFDACLMQDIEIAAALEPYADYYLASEETEGGYGWYYTTAFGLLAENPGISTPEFARELVATYDPYNTIIKDEDGAPDTQATISLVDLTLAKPAYQELCKVFKSADAAIRDDSANYASMSLAAMNSYMFFDDVQIDLIDYLTLLNRIDYRNKVCSEEQLLRTVNAVKACVLFRNANSANGVNGMAFAFPYKAIIYYGDTSKQTKALKLKDERAFFNDFFSIMAAQKKKASEEGDTQKDKDRESVLLAIIEDFLGEIDYTKESWYVKGFEDYETQNVLIDIPLIDAGDGVYQIDLPDKAWDIIADCQTLVYQQSEDSDLIRYLGTDHIGGYDENRHPTVEMTDTWVHINGNLVCYEDKPPRETDSGDIFLGTTKARLNDSDDIILNIEWNTVASDGFGPEEGHVVGYTLISDSAAGSSKGTHILEAGDTIQFLFDYYDNEGNYIKTAPYGNKIRITKMNRLTVRDEALPDGDYLFSGLLTDVYQRTLMTEQLEGHVGSEEDSVLN